jgi:hypothetical protein
LYVAQPYHQHEAETQNVAYQGTRWRVSRGWLHFDVFMVYGGQMTYTHFKAQKIFNCWLIAFFGIGALLMFLAIPRGNAQLAGTGSIDGVVTDSTGAAIQDASVTATDTATQIQHAATTNASGLYSFPNLPIGTYTVGVTATGFESYSQSNIVLDVGSSIAVKISMKVGTVGETVSVRASALALQTQNSSVQQTIPSTSIVSLPLNGRLTSGLILLTGGTVNSNEGSSLTGSKNFQTAYEVSIAGAQGSQTMVDLDGANNMEYQSNTGLPLPFPDAVAEFSVETAAMNAGSGEHPGGLVNVVTKSGTNQFHGAGFEFIRNNVIDATNFFSTRPDQLHLNQFGGVIGGPVIRDKLFFFVGYQRLNETQAQANTTSYVPTAANLQGDFSASDPNIQLLDPHTGIKLVNNNYADTPGVTWSPNPQALALEKYFPPTTAANGLTTYSIPIKNNENQFVTREDYVFNKKNSLYGRYFLDGYVTPAVYSPTNVLLTTNPGNYERTQAFTLGEVFTPTSSLVNTAHFTFTRQRNDREPDSTGITSNTIGVDNYNYPGAVGLEIETTAKWNTYCGTCFFASFNSNYFGIADDVNWVHGPNQIAFGGSFARAQFNSNNVFESNGNYGFTGNYSQFGPTGSRSATGPVGTGQDANLDFLTGAINTFTQSAPEQDALRAPITSLYFVDTYQANRRTVLTAGLQWSPEFYQTDVFGRGGAFSLPNFLGNVHSTVYPLAGAGTLYYGDPGIPKNYTKNAVFQMSPRIGITYDPTGKGNTVVRAGMALVYDTAFFFLTERMQDNPPWGPQVTNTPTTGPLNFSNPWSSGSVIGNPFPAAYLPNKAVPNPLNSQYGFLAPRMRSQDSLQWTFSVQHSFGTGWQAEFDYIGNRSQFYPMGQPLSLAIYIPGTWGPGGTGCSPIATTGPNAVKPGAAGTPCSTTANQASRFRLTTLNPAQGPYYAGGAVTTTATPEADGSYNGAIFSLQHRLSSSFVLVTNYTWSHCINIFDDNGGTGTVQNWNNIKGDKANCGYDFRSVYNMSVVATSNFSSDNRVLSNIINRWTIAPLVRITDGNPFTVTSGIDNSLTDNGLDRPNLTYTAPVYTHKTLRSGPAKNAQYINAAAFQQNATGTFGTLGRNAFRGPNYIQGDCSLSRAFTLHEELALHLRLDAFNVLNHPNLSAPGSGSGYIGSTNALTASTFGAITAITAGSSAREFQAAVKLTF